MKYPVSLTLTLFSMLMSCNYSQERSNFTADENSTSTEENKYKVIKVEFTDHKALNHEPIFEIKYTFESDKIKNLTIMCNDNKAKTTLSSPQISNGALFNLEGGDFYCFRLESLATDLSDYTDEYIFPSFLRGSEATASFDTPNEGLNLTLQILESGISVLRQDSSLFGVFSSENQTLIELTSEGQVG